MQNLHSLTLTLIFFTWLPLAHVTILIYVYIIIFVLNNDPCGKPVGIESSVGTTTRMKSSPLSVSGLGLGIGFDGDEEHSSGPAPLPSLFLI
jgi:hypothetical protein